MVNNLSNSFSIGQKKAVFVFIKLIVECCEKKHEFERGKVLNTLILSYGLNNNEFNIYEENINPDEFQKKLKSLSNFQIDLLMSMSIDVLLCTGPPSENDITLLENCFVKIIGMSEEQVYNSIEKILKLSNLFNSNVSTINSNKNVVEKTYDRMIREAQDPNQSSFSLNNIVFIIFTVLALLGLLSLCS